MNSLRNNIKALSWTSDGIWCSFVVCITIVAGTVYNIFSLVAFAISVIAIMLLSEEKSLCFMMFIMSFANIFKTNPKAQSFFTYLLLFYVLLYFVRSHHINKSFLISFMCFAAFLVVQMFFSINIYSFIKLLANILFVYIAVKLKIKNDAKMVYIYYILGVVVSSLVAALNISPNIVDYIALKTTMIGSNRVSRFAGMYGDPNYYSINVIISLCLVVVLNHKKQLSNVPSICLAAILLVFAGMTMSKSAFLMLFLPAMLLLYAKFKRKSFFTSLCLLVACIAVVITIFFGENEAFEIIRYRFNQANDLNSFTTGRTEIWQKYIAFLADNPRTLLLGQGLNANHVDSHVAHNTYIDLIYYLGVVGTLLLIVVFNVIIKDAKKTTRRNFLNYSGWICVGIMYFFLSELFYFDWAFHVTNAILLLRADMDVVAND